MKLLHYIFNHFSYCITIIDVYSRYIVGWGLYNSLDASNAIEVLDAAVRRHGAPEIINSDRWQKLLMAEL